MKKLLLAVSTILLSLTLWATSAQASYQPPFGGEYTNICSQGENPSNSNSCGKCDANGGSCTGTYVLKTICDGWTTNCDNSHTKPFAISHVLTGSQFVNNTYPGFNKTVQLDVFNKDCQPGDKWSCDGSNLQDYIVWFSGVAPTPTQPVPTVTPTIPPATVTPTRVPTTIPTVTPVQRQDQRQNVNCGNGTYAVYQDSDIICIPIQQQQQQIAYGGNATATGGSVNMTYATNPSSQPQVVYMAAGSTLPKTGLPLAAWLSGGLLPAGLALRRFGKGASILHTAHNIFELRKALKD